MRYRLIVLSVAALTVLLGAALGCSDGGRSESAPEPAAQKAAVAPAPDTTTFFPLIEGSYWVYNEVLEGEVQDDGLFRREVVGLQQTGSGYEAIVLEMFEGSPPDTVYYRCDSDGRVWQKQFSDTAFVAFADLQPRPRSQVGEFTYYPCLSDSSTCLLLQNFVYEDATYEQQLEWQSYTFVKGVGLTCFGGAEMYLELAEYRIGRE